MVRSLRTVGTCADVVILVWEDALELSPHQRRLVRILDIKLVETWQPVVEADIPAGSFLHERMLEKGKYWDFTRLQAFTLLQYQVRAPGRLRRCSPLAPHPREP